MNNPNSITPPSSQPEQKNNSRARVRMAVSCILALHLVGLLALLMQGCRKPTEDTASTEPTNTPPAFDTSYTPAVDTNPPPTTYTTDTNPPVQPVAPATPTTVSGASQEYTIAQRDTLATIAPRFGVSVKALQEANPGVVPTRLKIGQKINIPAPATAAVTPASGGAAVATTSEQTYKVKSGDNLTKIAKDHGVTLKALRSANNLKTDSIKVGQELKIPAKTDSAPAATPTL